MPQSVPQVNWDEVILITSYLAEHGETAKNVAYAVEKPWKFLDVLDAAKKELSEGE